MRNIFFYILSFLMASCTTKNPQISFKNDSFKIDSVKISVSKKCPSLIFKEILHNEIKKGKIVFCEALRSDGSYGIEIFSKGKIIKQSGFGYYTNGNSLNNSFNIVLTKDHNIIVEEK